MALPAELADELTGALTEIHRRTDYAARFRAFDEGQHILLLARHSSRETLIKRLVENMRLNMCPAVVNALNDRLVISGWNEDESEAAKILWDQSRMNINHAAFHRQAMVDGDMYLLAWPHPETGIPHLYPEPVGCWVRYDPLAPGVVDCGFKLWKVAAPGAQRQAFFWRLNVFERDVIRKYITANPVTSRPERGGLFDVFEGTPDDPGELANPYGVVPLFHFANNAPIGWGGRSELTEAAPVQNALNKTVIDTLVGAEFMGLPQRWMTGVEFEGDIVDGSGDPDEPDFNYGADRIVTVPDEAARVGQFDPADLASLTGTAEFYKLSMAQATGTPIHHFQLSSDPPSGEALKTMEGPLVARAQRRIDTWGATWEAVMALALTQAGTPLSGDGEDVSGGPQPSWEQAATRDELREVEVVATKIGSGLISKRQALRELGYDDVEIEEIMKELETEEQKADERRQAMFDAGDLQGANNNDGGGFGE